MNRRKFVRLAGAGAAGWITTNRASSSANRPNILLLLTDQQNFRMMSCAGNRYLRTPAMDALASRGTRFARAYCANPVCIPSRFSLFTGRLPSEIGLRSNSTQHLTALPERVRSTAMGWLLRKGGYEAAYLGKEHFPRAKAADLGFDYLDKDERDGCARAAVEFLGRPHESPFLLVCSFINPHDICYMAIRDFATTDFDRMLIERGQVEIATLDRALERPAGISDERFWRDLCPPAPPNLEPQKDEPEAIQALLEERPFRKNAREKWSDERWRLHRWAYTRLTEMVDAQIGRVTSALWSSRYASNTVVIFSSDHGDLDSAHRMEHKSCLYEEAVHVPLIIAAPDSAAHGTVDRTHLVSNGLDLLPTVCDFAGVDPPQGLAGKSARPLLGGRRPRRWRDWVPVESEVGNAIVTERYKYALHHAGANSEQLFDLREDPYETRNFAGLPERKRALEEHRRTFARQWPRPI
jgi:arylsulfatase A-like enzyme